MPEARQKVRFRSQLANQREAGPRVAPSQSGLPLLRNSERSEFKTCRWKWSISYGARIKPHTSAPALRFGTLIHAAQACWYIPGKVRGEHPAEAFKRLYAEETARALEFGWKDEDGRWQNAGELGVAMLENYIEEYGDDPLWEVVVTEHPFQTLVHSPDTGEPWFYYVGILDGVWRYIPDGKLWIPDHKTTDGIGEKKWSHLALDDQCGGYWTYGVDALYAQGLLPEGERLEGMLYNLMRKAMPDERPSKVIKGHRQYLNLDGSISKRQPAKFFERRRVFRDAPDREAARQRAIDDYAEIEGARNGTVTTQKNPNIFWTCPNCWLRDICELHEVGADWQEMLRMTTKKWDPYAEHEIRNGR